MLETTPVKIRVCFDCMFVCMKFGLMALLAINKLILKTAQTYFYHKNKFSSFSAMIQALCYVTAYNVLLIFYSPKRY